MKKTPQTDLRDLPTSTALQQRYKRHLEMMRGPAPDISKEFSNMNLQTKPPIKNQVHEVNLNNIFLHEMLSLISTNIFLFNSSLSSTIDNKTVGTISNSGRFKTVVSLTPQNRLTILQ